MRCKSPVSSALKRLGNNLTSVLLKDIYIHNVLWYSNFIKDLFDFGRFQYSAICELHFTTKNTEINRQL